MATQLVRLPTLYVLTELVGVYYLISNLVAIGLTFGIRYLVADNWIWAGRDRRDQVPIDGVLPVRRPRDHPDHLDGPPARAGRRSTWPTGWSPDIVIRRRFIGGRAASPRLDDQGRRRDDPLPRAPRGAVGGLRRGDRDEVELDANWLLTWSHHVLYTNMVEPLLRFMLVSRGYVLLHCAAIDAEQGAVIMSAQTDTGKTSTVLRLLMQRSWGFISDDMAIITPGGEILSYPKPMTLSSHTMSAVNDRRPALGGPVHAGHPQPGPLQGRAISRPRPRPAERADRHDERLGPAPHPAAQVPRPVAHRLRPDRPGADRHGHPDGARRHRRWPRSRASS